VHGSQPSARWARYARTPPLVAAETVCGIDAGAPPVPSRPCALGGRHLARAGAALARAPPRLAERRADCSAGSDPAATPAPHLAGNPVRTARGPRVRISLSDASPSTCCQHLPSRYAGHRGLLSLEHPTIALFRQAATAKEAPAPSSDGARESAQAPSKRRRPSAEAPEGAPSGELDSPTSTAASPPPPTVATASPAQAVFQRLRRIRDSLARGTLPLAETVPETLRLAPDLPSAYPQLYFRLCQCYALEAIRENDTNKALSILRNDLCTSSPPPEGQRAGDPFATLTSPPWPICAHVDATAPLASKHADLAAALAHTAIQLLYKPRGDLPPQLASLPLVGAAAARICAGASRVANRVLTQLVCPPGRMHTDAAQCADAGGPALHGAEPGAGAHRADAAHHPAVHAAGARARPPERRAGSVRQRRRTPARCEWTTEQTRHTVCCRARGLSFAPLFAIPALKRSEDVTGDDGLPTDWDAIAAEVDATFAQQPLGACAPSASDAGGFQC